MYVRVCFIRMITMIALTALVGCSSTMLTSTSESDGQANQALTILFNNAQAAQENNNLDTAEGWLMRAMRISPTDPEVYYRMALLKQTKGKSIEARELALRALSLSPNQAIKQDIKILLLQLSHPAS